MANDTSINGSSASDAIVPTNRKKQNSQGIDFSQQSFFEELLTIGQFKSTIPKETALPAAKPADNDRKTESDSDKEVANEANKELSQPETAANAIQVQAVLAAQAIAPQLQPPSAPTNQESTTGDKRDKTLIRASSELKKNGDEQAEPKQTAISPSTVAADSKVIVASNKNSISPVIVDNSATNAVDTATAESAPHLTDGDGKVLTDNNQPNHAVQKGRASSDSSDEKENRAKGENNHSQKHGIALKEFDSENKSVEESSKPNATETLANQPRNKRSERLAERASDGGSSSDERETTVDPTLDLQPTKERAPIENEFKADTNSLNLSTLPTSAGVSASTPPVIAQPVLSSTTGPTTLSSSKSNVENIVGVTSSRAGTGAQTGVSNTTISGNVAGPGRTDQGRSEVARSNSGTQITAYQEGKLVQRVLRGIEQLANGGGQVRLRLHPPELGALQMSLRMEAGQVFAKLEVENTTARDALLNNVQTLKDRMAEQGLKVAAFEVEVSTDSAGSGLGSSSSQADGGSGNPSRWENSSSQFAQQNSNRLPTEPTQAERNPGPAWTRTNGSLDLTV